MITALLMLAAAPSQVLATPASSTTPTDKVECRMIQEATSRIPNRVCRLSREWELLAQDAQEDLRSSRNQRSVVRN
jgi:hypothetical protein